MTSSSNRIVSLWDMLKTNSSWFVSVIRMIGVHEQWLRDASVVEVRHIQKIYDVCNTLSDNLSQLEVPATMAALKILKREAETGIRPPRLQQLLNNVSENLSAELQGKAMWIMSAKESAILKKRQKPFGTAVFDAFPESNDDLEEATLCFGLARYTAAVFHLMRAMERTVHRIALELHEVKEQKVWSFLLSDIQNACEKMTKRDPKRAAWLQAHALLFSVKEAWRNDVMHPKQSYTEEQAEDVYQATGAFLRHLAGLVPAPSAAV